MKAKLIRTSTLLMLALAFTGCVEMTLSNLTPKRTPQNPSGIYTLTMKPEIRDANAIKESFKPYVVIDGERHPMRKSSMGSNVYEYEYAMPANRSQAKYYFVIDYLSNVKGTARERTETSQLYTLELVNRYVITMLSQRGPVGAVVPVVGRGFTKYDKIEVGGEIADTHYNSSNSLSFTVPALTAGRSYPVKLISGNGSMFIGEFLIDVGQLRVTPSSVEVMTGERTMLVFSTNNEAPASGILIDVTTDIPDSVIMPEVVITKGTRSVSVPLEGGTPGEGSLYIHAAGFKEVQIPVSVLSKDAPFFEQDTVRGDQVQSMNQIHLHESVNEVSIHETTYTESHFTETNQQTPADGPWAAPNANGNGSLDHESEELPF